MESTRQRISLQKIIDEYEGDIFKDDDYMYRLKEIIDSLPDLDKALLIVYSDEMSMAKTGKKFGVSSTTIHQRIKKIREYIKERL